MFFHLTFVALRNFELSKREVNSTPLKQKHSMNKLEPEFYQVNKSFSLNDVAMFST